MDIINMIEQIKHRSDYHKVGMILCHNGVVRESSKDGRKVRGMRVTVDQEPLAQVLHAYKKRPGIIEVLVQICADQDLNVGDDIMFLVLAGDVRENVITA